MPDLPDWTSAPITLIQGQVAQSITVSETLTTTTLYNVPASRGIVVTKISLSAIGWGFRGLREPVVGVVSWGGGPTIIAPVAISPVSGTITVDVPPATSTVPAGSTIQCQLQVGEGGGSSDVYVTLSYYQAS